LLREDGFAYDAVANTFSNSLQPSAAGTAEDRLKRLMRMHIFPGVNDGTIDSERKDFAGGNISQYGNWGFTVNYYGDAIRFKDNKLQAAGNIEDNTFVTVTPVGDTYNNGQVFNVDRLLQYSARETGAGDDAWKDKKLWYYLDKASKENRNVEDFVGYVERCLKDENGDLSGIKPENYYTVLMPNANAMQRARSTGLIKELALVTTANAEAMAQATKFVNAHFLQGRVLVDDGAPYLYPVNPSEPNRALLPTLLKITNEGLDLTNASTFVEVTKAANGTFLFAPQDILLGNKVLVDGHNGANVAGTIVNLVLQRGTTSTPDSYRSNRIACKAILHEITNTFVFEEKTN
jgi:hypothetical protein